MHGLCRTIHCLDITVLPTCSRAPSTVSESVTFRLTDSKFILKIERASGTVSLYEFLGGNVYLTVRTSACITRDDAIERDIADAKVHWRGHVQLPLKARSVSSNSTHKHINWARNEDILERSRNTIIPYEILILMTLCNDTGSIYYLLINGGNHKCIHTVLHYKLFLAIDADN